MPRNKILSSTNKISNAIQAHARITESSLNKTGESFIGELKGLRIEVREHLLSSAKRTETLKFTEEALIEKVEANAATNKARNTLLEQVEAIRGEKPSADAWLTSKSTLLGAGLASSAAVLVFILQYYTNTNATDEHELKIAELESRLNKKDDAIAARDRRIATVPSIFWAVASLFETKESKTETEPPQLK